MMNNQSQQKWIIEYADQTSAAFLGTEKEVMDFARNEGDHVVDWRPAESINPTVNGEINIQPAEHEIFLSFNEDVHAEIFSDWWYLEGLNHFNKFAIEKREYYD